MITVRLMKTARTLIDWDQARLAAASGVSLPTIQRMEKLGPERSSMANVQRILGAFDRAGIEFISSNGGGPGVRLKENKNA